LHRGALPASLLAILLSISGCGGGNSTPANSTPTPSGSTNTGGGPTPATSATVINVGAGQNVTGADINVSPPAASPPANAELLGVAPLNSGGTASNSGATIHQGTAMKVLLFGAGLNGNMTVSISGPGDITVANIRSITSTSGTPGVAFDATLTSSAALGARTVFLKSSNGDITTFTGGLEVIP
jgi:hypothetical protein